MRLFKLIVAVCLFYSPLVQAGFFDSIKDKAIKEYAGCYKNSMNARDKCMKTVHDNFQALTSGNPEEEGKKYDQELEKCSIEAEATLIKCRLDKGKFKEGCDEKKMQSELLKADDKELKCNDPCGKECIKSNPTPFSAWQGCVSKCVDACMEPEQILKRHNEAFKECISVEK